MKVILTPLDGTLPALLTSKELQVYLRVSRGTAEKFGKACGAERRVGKRILFDLETINEAIQKKSQE